MKKSNLKDIYVILFVLLIIGMVIAIILANINYTIDNNLTFEKCCGGNACSDTYYDEERDVCILTLCKSLYIFNKSKCEYKPLEKEIEK